MYGALWRLLPGGVVLKLLQLLVIASIVLLTLFEWVFPWIAQSFMAEQSTLD
jgi:hypothetical protein